ncbi:unnamed protein product [Pleuronectes platessa]|uniref:Uncharacterized protein n=1 Tax=Pleuronectes platessa TaxID=8262 RepID=A0A9N7W0J3_PLEPL|nr:unnamed protein product [Pleuronectes platessa]
MVKLINKNQIITCETQKRRTPYIGCPGLRSMKEKELRESWVLETKLQQETTPTIGLSCRKVEAKMSWRREKRWRSTDLTHSFPPCPSLPHPFPTSQNTVPPLYIFEIIE